MKNTIVLDFFNLIFQNALFPLTSRSTRVTKPNAAIIDVALTNSIIDSEVQSGIIKTHASNRFVVLALMKAILVQSNIKKTFIKRGR